MSFNIHTLNQAFQSRAVAAPGGPSWHLTIALWQPGNLNLFSYKSYAGYPRFHRFTTLAFLNFFFFFWAQPCIYGVPFSVFDSSICLFHGWEEYSIMTASVHSPEKKNNNNWTWTMDQVGLNIFIDNSLATKMFWQLLITL